MPELALLQGDVRTVTPDGKFHAILCDPPYELGFMGKHWDKSGVAFDPETWRRLGEFLLPGGHLLAFAGARTQHRIACAIEDAGFEIRDCICWTFGSGFPKSMNIAKQVEGKDGRLGWESPNSGKYSGDGSGMCRPGTKRMPNVDVEIETDAGKIWTGYGTALKPAYEPIICARKQLSEPTVAANCVKHGTGAYSIDGSRITGVVQKGAGSTGFGVRDDNYELGTGRHYSTAGRWPANLLLTDSDDVRAMFPYSGASSARAGKRAGKRAGTYGAFAGQDDVVMGHDDSGGSAARFFHQVKLDDADPIYYCAKASRAERDAGCDGMERKVCAIGDQRPGGTFNERLGPRQDGTMRKDTAAANTHPTLKPLDLCRYLAKLILPPAAYAPRRILVPFAGSGSEMIGAMQAGWNEIVGIEQEQEYVEIAKRRIAYWKSKLTPEQTEMAFTGGQP